MANVNIKIEGLNTLAQKFKGSPKVFRHEIGRAIKLSTLKIQREAKKIVPVDTGNLQKNIRVFQTLKGKTIEGLIRAQTPYAAYIEYGQPTGTGPHGGPRPYMRPAADMSKNDIMKFFKEAKERISKQLV